MMSVPVVLGAGKSRDQDIGAKSANDAHDISERHIVTAPFLKSFVRSLRISEISNTGKSLLNSVVAIGGQQLQRAQHPEHIEQTAAELVLSAFATSQREQQGLHAFSARLHRQQATILVVRMCDDHHQTAGGL